MRDQINRNYCSLYFSVVIKFFILLIINLFLNSCAIIPATAPKKNKPTKLGISHPKEWLSYKNNKNNKNSKLFKQNYDWVKEIGGQPLKKVVNQALENNPNIEEATANVQLAYGNLYISGAERKPLLNFGLKGSKQKQSFIGFPTFGSLGGNNSNGEVLSATNKKYGISFDLSWEIDIWGRLLAKKRSSIANYQSSLEYKRAIGLSIAAQTAKAYFSCLESQAQINLANLALANYTETENSMRESLGIDTLSSQLRLAMVDVESAKSELANRKLIHIINIRQLQILLGKYPSGEITDIVGLKKFKKSSSSDQLKKIFKILNLKKFPPPGLPAELLERRPDILSAERDVASSLMSLKEAKLNLLPRISLNSSLGTLTEKFKDILKRDFEIWNIAGNLLQPILSGNALRGGVKISNAAVMKSIANYKKVVLKAFFEVENAFTSERLLKQREKSLQAASELATQAHKSALDDYREGSVNHLTVLTSQNKDIVLKSQLISIRKAIIDNRINLHLALGGDFILNNNDTKFITKAKYSKKN